MKNTRLTSLSNRDLIAAVDRLAACERGATASLVAHLAELYGRRLHERAGYSSLYTYCLSVLRLSESAAYDRMKAAKVARRHPIVLDLLASGRINLTAVRLLAPYLTRDNCTELFAAACGKRKRQVQEILAVRFPRPDVPSSVRKLPAVTSAAVVVPPMAVPPMTALPPPGAAPRVPPTSPPLVVPLSSDRYRVTVTVSGDTCQTLELAQDLLRHAIPSGDPAEIVARALKVLVEDLVKRKFAITHRSRQQRRAARDPGEPTAEVKRASLHPRTGDGARPWDRMPQVWRARVPRVPPHPPAGRGWARDGRQHFAAVSRAQRVRGRFVLRAREALFGRGERRGGGEQHGDAARACQRRRVSFQNEKTNRRSDRLLPGGLG